MYSVDISVSFLLNTIGPGMAGCKHQFTRGHWYSDGGRATYITVLTTCPTGETNEAAWFYSFFSVIYSTRFFFYGTTHVCFGDFCVLDSLNLFPQNNSYYFMSNVFFFFNETVQIYTFQVRLILRALFLNHLLNLSRDGLKLPCLGKPFQLAS